MSTAQPVAVRPSIPSPGPRFPWREPRATYNFHGKLIKADTCEDVYTASVRGDIVLHALARGTYPGTRLAAGDLAGVKSLGFWDATHPQWWGLPWHGNEGIELTVLSSGSLPYFCEEKGYQLKPCDLTIARPWQPHKVGDPTIGANRLYFLILDVGVRRPNQEWEWPGWLLMSESERDDLTRLLRLNEVHVWPDCREFLHCFQDIGKAVVEYQLSRDTTFISLKLNELFYLLLRMFRTRTVPLNESLTSNIRTVELFLGDLREMLTERWSIRRMARECSVCTTHFVQYCRQITNRSPMQLLRALRLEKAQRMLIEHPDMPVIDVAMECGFSSSQYFASCFGREFAATPSGYRESHRTA